MTSASFYRGPGKTPLMLDSLAAVETAAASGALDETRWVELKQEVPASSKPANLELAKDLASLSVDGGLLIVGIEDAGGHRAGAVVGARTEGIRERIDQVCGARVEPPLHVETSLLSDAARSVAIVTVPASEDAPHMVDHLYWGRGDTGKRPLSDVEVSRLFSERLGKAESFELRLRRVRTEFDRLPFNDSRHSHVVILVEPSSRARQMSLMDALDGRHPFQVIHDSLSFGPQWPPTFESLTYTTNHTRGVGATSLDPTTPITPDSEENLLSVMMQDDGSVLAACGRGSWTPPRSDHSNAVLVEPSSS